MVPLADAADRRLIREALDQTVLVEAAAGTGKTTELVQRLLNVIAQGRARVEQIVAVTFTEKAAGELKLRIRQELETRRQQSSPGLVQDRLTDAIRRLEEAHVSTIHGFCADLLRERPVEARVDPLFQVLTEMQAERLFTDAFRAWLHEQLDAPPEGIRRALRRSVWSKDGRDWDDGPIERLRGAARQLAEWRDFRGTWRRPAFDREGALEAVMERVRELAALSSTPGSTRDPLFVDTAPVRELAHEFARARTLGLTDADGWEARAVDLAQNRDLKRARRGRDRTYGSGVARDQVWAAYETLMLELGHFQERADADLAALLHDELGGAIGRYTEVKQKAGALDFVDLLLRVRDLLVEDAQVRRVFQARFTHFFVDEFQDTDPLQAEILLLLAADDPRERDWQRVSPIGGKLFFVGDPKQAIYRFRRADLETYREVCDLLERRGGKRAFLHTSFRATPSIQRMVNAAFAPLMDGTRETLQAEHVSLSPYRPETGSQPSVVVLPVPEPYGQRRVAGYAIEKSFPHAVGAFIDWLLRDSGWTVTDRTARDELPMAVPIQPRHICVLFRRFFQYGADVTRPYVEALEARGVPHLLVGGKSFHGREEVETIRAALAAVEWPDDELSVFATLRGALFAIDDESLFLYRQRHHALHPFKAQDDAEFPMVTEALAVLRRLHARRNYRPVAETLTDLLAATRAHVGFVLRSAGEQALANVLHVAELARQYEANGGISFRGFVDLLQEQADGFAAEAPILEEGTDGVRLMTTHKAKGLEFPVVVLADMTARLRSERADRLVDRANHACYMRLARWTPVELAASELLELAKDEAEGVRVAYVAATRARDLLVVPGIGDTTWDGGWISPLNAAVYPASERRRDPQLAVGCPAFKRDSVCRRPDNDPALPETVRPGAYELASEQGPYQIVWWDPTVLDLDVATTPGIRRDALILKDVPDAVVRDGLQQYQAWQDRRASALASSSRPTVAIRTATEWAATEEPLGSALFTTRAAAVVPEQPGLFDEPVVPQSAAAAFEQVEATVEIVTLDGRVRPGGARFGELVHAVLGSTPLDAAAPTIRASAELHGRILSAAPDEIASAAALVVDVLATDLLRRARAAAARGRCRRETPVSLSLADGSLIEGVVDLAFEEGGVWIVIDYKTDRELADLGELRYRRQVALYVSAIGQASGRPTRGYLMRV